MKFVVSSIELLNHLQTVSRVISSKNTLPILDNVLPDTDGAAGCDIIAAQKTKTEKIRHDQTILSIQDGSFI